MATQKELDIVYLNMADCMGQLSKATRAKVGCLIVNEKGKIISQGYNGTPTGFDNCCEDVHCSCNETCAVSEQFDLTNCKKIVNGGPCKYLTLTTKKEVLHAESNAIAKCAKWGGSTDGATLYVSLSPCFECAKLIAQSGIKRVVYRTLYRDESGIELLKKLGVTVEKL